MKLWSSSRFCLEESRVTSTSGRFWPSSPSRPDSACSVLLPNSAPTTEWWSHGSPAPLVSQLGLVRWFNPRRTFSFPQQERRGASEGRKRGSASKRGRRLRAQVSFIYFLSRQRKSEFGVLNLQVKDLFLNAEHRWVSTSPRRWEQPPSGYHRSRSRPESAGGPSVPLESV